MNFSLYRGNLHKVPDVPRRWPLVKPSISLQVFQKAIAKRHEAVLRLRAPHSQSECGALADQESEQEALHRIKQSDCKPLHDEDGEEFEEEHGRKRKREDAEAFGLEMEGDGMEVDDRVSVRKPRMCSDTDLVMTESTDVDGVNAMDCDTSLPHVTCDVLNQAEMGDANGAPGVCHAEQSLAAENISLTEKEPERLEAPRTPAAKDEECAKPTERIQMTREQDGCVPLIVPTTVEPFVAGRKAELQETLKQLQETKHQLVQILKQVLISEEESKRKGQGLLQYSAAYATVGTIDLPLDQKTGSEMQSTDLEEGELEYTRNSGPTVVASSYGSHFAGQPQTLGATLGRQFTNSQQQNKL
eukprot:c16315_g1_i1 orf=126-1199(+)